MMDDLLESHKGHSDGAGIRTLVDGLGRHLLTVTLSQHHAGGGEGQGA